MNRDLKPLDMIIPFSWTINSPGQYVTPGRYSRLAVGMEDEGRVVRAAFVGLAVVGMGVGGRVVGVEDGERVAHAEFVGLAVVLSTGLLLTTFASACKCVEVRNTCHNQNNI